MATVVFSALGAGLGSSFGGTFLGLSMTAVGRFAGAAFGRMLDEQLMGQGSEPVEVGRLDRLRFTQFGEGQPIAQVYGRTRIGGQLIWASEFEETIDLTGRSSANKTKPNRAETKTYSYSVSLAIALCRGEITHVARVWADGVELGLSDINMRVHTGSETQLPDLKIEAVEGTGKAPAYRGIAYVVIEDLPLSQFGNRVPQFNFEVCRPAQSQADLVPEVSELVQAVTVMPGTGEYALATTEVSYDYGQGQSKTANVNSPAGVADIAASLTMLSNELPKCGAASLVVSWFGGDLRCAACELRPKVEQHQIEGAEMAWRVAGLDRAQAEQVLMSADGRPIYGGTPSDASVIEAIKALKAAGQDVMFYPFILMDQAAGNDLPDPYSDAVGQAALPWRGRITLSKAPSVTASPDQSAAAADEVKQFFGQAKASDFSIVNTQVRYHGPDEWSYQRMVLHYAFLCQAAGGVSAFCIGSEMRGLMQIRGSDNTFVAVQEMRKLAAEVRAVLGPRTKLGYAADWSEYSGYQPSDGSGDKFFHLDPLWADRNIDFIGIDNYMPLSDWQDGESHHDANWGSIYNIDYLKANIEGGEGYDWYYQTHAARVAQSRTPIADETHAEPWIWRYKDIRNWWSNSHHERHSGVRQTSATDWVPMSKPIWFTEIGCAALDKATNQPNKFLDPKSSESDFPYFSNGQRDEYIQMQYLRALTTYWAEPSKNPVSPLYHAPMIDMSRAFVWAWDARPYPWFPRAEDLWSDGANYARGHWINGRVSGASLASVVAEICEQSGFSNYDVSQLHGYLRGYHLTQVTTARSLLQPLAQHFGFDAIDNCGRLKFLPRNAGAVHDVTPAQLVATSELAALVETTRDSTPDLTGRVQMTFAEADGHYQVRSEEVILASDRTHAVTNHQTSLVMTPQEARQTLERWLIEMRVARDSIRFGLPLSQRSIGPGDRVRMTVNDAQGIYRVDHAELGQFQLITATRIEPSVYQPSPYNDASTSLKPFVPPLPVLAVFLDLPLMSGDEVPHAPHVAVTAEPWPGSVATYSADHDADYHLDHLVYHRSKIGQVLEPLPAGPLGLVDHGHVLRVALRNADLRSVSETALLAGKNTAAIGDGSAANWEVIQFQNAELIGKDEYQLSGLLRGQAGSDAAMRDVWPKESLFILLDGAPVQLDLKSATRQVERHYRIGPAKRAFDDPTYRHQTHSFSGIGLRPYRPCHLTVKPGDGGLDITWIRRGRIDADPWSETEIPLGETFERYRVRIISGGQVLREHLVDAPAWQYSKEHQDTDNPSGENLPIWLDVAQLSERFGVGPSAGIKLS